MPITSNQVVTLTADDHATRVRIDYPGTTDITVQVGSPSEAWPDGCYIEVVNLNVTSSLALVPFDGEMTFNVLSGTNKVQVGEYARVSLVSPGVWDMHVYTLDGYLFKVGVPISSHIHYAVLTSAKAKELIQNTSSSAPVGDGSQPSALIWTEPNGNSPGQEHTHQLTVFFDYVKNTFVATSISNNSLDNHQAVLVGGGGVVEPANHVVIGTDTGTTSSGFFTFSPEYFNFRAAGPETGIDGSNNLVSYFAEIKTDNFGDIDYDGDEGGHITLRSGYGTLYGGNVSVFAGGSEELPGVIEIKAGAASAEASYAHGGDVTLQAGASIATAGGGNGGRARVFGGESVSSNGGPVEISGGYGGANGGNVIISGGPSDLAPGTISFSTSDIDRLRILPNGEFEIAGSVGDAGNVLTSDGPGGAPYWAPPSDGGEFDKSLDDLSDVLLSAAPSSEDVLTFDANSDMWIAQQPQRIVKPAPLTPFSITATGSYSFGSALHHSWHIRSTAAAVVTVTIQPDAFWAGSQQFFENGYQPNTPSSMPPGGSMLIGKHAAGDVIIQPGAGVIINTPDTLTITRLHGKAMLIKVGPNEWDLEGNIGT